MRLLARIFHLTLAACLLMAGTARAQKYEWPVACTLGEDCWLMNTVDIDPAAGSARDSHCGTRTYDAHTGTDIAIADGAAMRKGYAVLSIADGKVLRLRDGEEDRLKATPEDVQAVKDSKRECGNGILIQNNDGTKAQYCHLKKGSLQVKPGDVVKAGQPLADIGLSGLTQHPHAHISLLDAGNHPLDPLGGKVAKGACESADKAQIKSAKPIYSATDLINIGLSGTAPDYQQVLLGDSPAAIAGDTNTIIWMVGFGLQKGDEIVLQVTAPDGQMLVNQRLMQEAPKARQFYFAGARKPIVRGAYQLQATLVRGGTTIDTLRKTVQAH